MVTDIAAEIVDLEAAVSQHDTEKTDLTALYDAAVEAKAVVTRAKDANILLKDKAIEERDGCAENCKTKVQDGTVAIELAKTNAQ